MAVNEPTEENTTRTKTFKTRIKHKRDTSANWESRNPVLLNGEVIIVDTANGETRTKTGDGTKTYTQLPFDDEGTKGGKSLIDKSFADKVSTSGNTTTIDNQLKTYSITTRLEADVAITGLDENGQEVIKHKLSEKANASDVLTKTNTSEFTPTADYQPATKKYVDNNKLSDIANGEPIGTVKIGRTGALLTEGPYSTAIGFGGHTSADALGSIAMCGGECLASFTVAMGNCTVASGTDQFVQGKYNVKDTGSKYVHIIGNGTSDTARSNAHTVDWNGNAWFSGDIEGVKDGTTHKLSEKVDKVSGKSLSTNDYTDNDKAKLDLLSKSGSAITLGGIPESGEAPHYICLKPYGEPRTGMACIEIGNDSFTTTYSYKGISGSDGTNAFTVGGTEISCAGHKLTEKAEAKIYTVSVSTISWTEKTDTDNQKYYYKKITVSGMTASGQAMTDVAMSDSVATARKEMEAYQCVNRVVTGSGYVELYCFEEVPTTPFTLRILVISNVTE